MQDVGRPTESEPRTIRYISIYVRRRNTTDSSSHDHTVVERIVLKLQQGFLLVFYLIRRFDL